MKNLLFTAAFAMLVGGCAATSQPSIPVDYTGPTAVLNDSFEMLSASKVNFFYADSIDGNNIDNARKATVVANQGKGIHMSPKKISRQIPARPIHIELVGRTEYAAPILALAGTVFQVKGIVEFTPEADKTYSVHGELGENYSAVWIQEDISKTIVAQKIEVKGSAALGVFEK